MPRPQPTRRERIAAIAATADYNPEEAAVAQGILDAMPDHSLDSIAAAIREEWGRGIDAQFAIGRLLIEARAMHADDMAFGRWLTAQDLPFDRHMAYKFREATIREPAVRAIIAGRTYSRQATSSIAATYDTMTRKPKPLAIDTGPTPPVDPAYAALRAARFAILGTDAAPINAFTTMHVDDLRESAATLTALVAAYQAARRER